MKPGEIILPQGRLETGWWGPGAQEAPTLVLLHDGLGSLGLWRDFPARLAEATGCGVFAYSRHGYGGSDPVALPRPLDFMRIEACAVLPRVLDAIGLRSFVLVGHSDGASITAIYAGSHQDFRIHGLVLMAPHCFTEEVGLAAIAATKQRYDTGDLRPRLARHHAHVDVAFNGWADAWLDPRFPQEFDLLADIAHIRVPMLAIQGEADSYGTAEQLHVLQREAYCPVQTLFLPGIDHAPHLEAPDAVLAAVHGFTTKLRQSRQGA